MHGWSSRCEVGEEGQSMHADLAHQPIGQTPQIMTPEAFERRLRCVRLIIWRKTISNAIAPTRELPTHMWPGIMEAATEGSQQRQSMARELFI